MFVLALYMREVERTHTHRYIYIYTHTYIYIYMYVYIYIHTYQQLFKDRFRPYGISAQHAVFVEVLHADSRFAFRVCSAVHLFTHEPCHDQLRLVMEQCMRFTRCLMPSSWETDMSVLE